MTQTRNFTTQTTIWSNRQSSRVSRPDDSSAERCAEETPLPPPPFHSPARWTRWWRVVRSLNDRVPFVREHLHRCFLSCVFCLVRVQCFWVHVCTVHLSGMLQLFRASFYRFLVWILNICLYSYVFGLWCQIAWFRYSALAVAFYSFFICVCGAGVFQPWGLPFYVCKSIFHWSLIYPV